jgi:carbamoyltransferase
VKEIHFPHSLGLLYSAFTYYTGFKVNSGEYKVMGLAPYGKPTFFDKMQEIVLLKKNGSYSLNLNLFRHHNENIKYEWNNCSPSIGNLFSDNLTNLLGVKPRLKNDPLDQVHYDIAHSTQAMYEEAFFHLLNATYNKNKIENLTLAGGCAMNSVANGKIYRRSKYKNVYIQSAAGDAGGAIGCAYVVASKLRLLNKSSSMEHAYLGPHFENVFHEDLIKKNRLRIEKSNCDIQFVDNENELCSLTAEEISNGNVIGWFQGRMEWGPRALGNRSILGDPRRSDMKDILNLKIKRRESFRPFAPSIMREFVSEWFEEDDDVPFMMQVFQIKENKRNSIPAVTHIDGSGRLQTVEQKTNKRYYMLIREFKKITGIPMLLNTSFNENEPVVCRPDEALETFLRTKMDLLVLGNWMIRRKPQE